MSFEELTHVERLAQDLSGKARVQVIAHARAGDEEFPVHAFSLGSEEPDAPVLGLFGGVHGLERIGTHLVTSYLSSLIERLTWDRSLSWQLEKMRLIAIPLINPAGMRLNRRGNANSVDLMRNAPISAGDGASFLLGGQRISPRIPWYMGDPAKMEAEAQAVCDFVRRESFSSRAALWLDVHSGFGTVDRLWFPYAKSKEPFSKLAEVYTLKNLFDQTYPNHVYRFEPQSKNYTTHGDLWDYLFDEYRKSNPDGGVALPLTLEMGSWAWVKKNPWQLFTFMGPFNPVKPHRHRRVLRRHIVLFDFLARAVASPEAWAALSDNGRMLSESQAMELWYSGIES